MPELAADTPEHCPRCTDGILFETASGEAGVHVHCFNCDYHESRPYVAPVAVTPAPTDTAPIGWAT